MHGFRMCALLVGALAARGVARADLFVEVTTAGETPDGQLSIITIAPFQVFDVYVWGTGPDSALLSLRLDVGAHTPFEFQVHTPGIVNPGGQFAIALPGSLNASTQRVEQVALGMIPPSLVALPSTPAQAMRIYAGLVASPEVGGRLSSFNLQAHTSGGSTPVIHAIGVQQVPAPGAGAFGLVVLTWGAGVVRRRRNAPGPHQR